MKFKYSYTIMAKKSVPFSKEEIEKDFSKWIRKILVKGIILNIRPKKSSNAYKRIWWKEGSPLIVLSQRLFDKVKKLITIPAALAMRYGSISIYNGIDELNKKGVD